MAGRQPRSSHSGSPLEALTELRIATGKPDEELSEQWRASFFFEAFLRRRLPDTEIEIAYPTYRVGEVLLSHGHYLDGEVRGSVPNRLMQGGLLAARRRAFDGADGR